MSCCTATGKARYDSKLVIKGDEGDSLHRLPVVGMNKLRMRFLFQACGLEELLRNPNLVLRGRSQFVRLVLRRSAFAFTPVRKRIVPFQNPVERAVACKVYPFVKQ